MPVPVAVENQCCASIDNRPPTRHYYLHMLARKFIRRAGGCMVQFLRNLCTDERGQDIAEYAVMLAVILVLVIGTVRLIGGNANNAFSSVASSLSN
jgi:Flp pilus assembly pilin Flp